MNLTDDHKQILEMIRQLYGDLFFHDGYGELKIEMRFLKKGQKEIIIHCGKDYRYVVDYPYADEMKGGDKQTRLEDSRMHMGEAVQKPKAQSTNWQGAACYKRR